MTRKQAIDTYTDTHWGVEPQEEIEVKDDEGLPEYLTQMGTLQTLKVKGLGDIDFSGFRPPCHLAFSTDKSKRLFVILTPAAVRECKERLTSFAYEEWGSPDDLAAKYAPGRQNRYTYPDLEMAPLGVLTEVIYLTDKDDNGDGTGGFANYWHKLGEDTGEKPIPCIDRKGRLWIVGGAYVVKRHGIIN